MQEVKVILTWEAIYDIVEITDYIESDFDKINLMIYKKPFPPSIIFYVVNEPKNEIHILRVLREERNWNRFFQTLNNIPIRKTYHNITKHYREFPR